MQLFKVIKPTLVTTDAQLVACSATESADTTWTAVSATFALAATCKYNHVRYECSQAYTSAIHYPDEINSLYWTELGPTNWWAQFDNQNSTVTTAVGTLVTRIAPGGVVPYAALLSVTGAVSATMELTDITGALLMDGGQPVYSQTIQLDNTFITNAFEYCFSPFDYKSEIIFGPIPLYATGTAAGKAQLKCTITGSSGGATVTCGGFFAGNAVELGKLLDGPTTGTKTYSRTTTDAFGFTTFVPGESAKTGTYVIHVEKADLRKVSGTIKAVKDVPVIWVGSEDVDRSDLVIFGACTNDSTRHQFSHSLLTLDILGII